MYFDGMFSSVCVCVFFYTNCQMVEQPIFNLFLANVPVLYPLKTPETFCFSGVFMGYELRNWLDMG